MNRLRQFIWAVPWVLVACSSTNNRDTIADLRHINIEIKEEKLEGGLEKAMLRYQRFLEENPDSELMPEAIRRLADLKIEKEYGTLTASAETAGPTPVSDSERDMLMSVASVPGASSVPMPTGVPVHEESEEDFENRTTDVRRPDEGTNDLERAGAREAIVLYKKLLKEYPEYERNDQVLYQMSRAYEELGQIDEAMVIMERLVRDASDSRYIDEVQFRRAEHFFAHKRYLDAEDAYVHIVKIGVASSYYDLALYKLGWTYYKQELYENALDRFIELLDYKVSVGYDFTQTEDEREKKRTEDTFRVISLSFSNFGGAESVRQYFTRHGKREYEDLVYRNLGEFYFDKRRYADASATYEAFVSRNAFHEAAPGFHMRVIEIQAAGGFPSLVLESKKKFATTYGLNAEYWNHFDPTQRPEVIGFLKTNLTDLANHYHACYQDPRQEKDKAANYVQASHWYRGYLTSFPVAPESSGINYQLANLLVENGSYGEAAEEFEKTAYAYPVHEKSAQAGYAAIVAYREKLSGENAPEKDVVKRKVVNSSLKFVDRFPEHKKAPIVLGAAADDLYGMQEYEEARAAANRLLELFPDADPDVIRQSWLVIAHSSYELSRYSEAESAYLNVLDRLPEEDESRGKLTDNLAISIYKQGEHANEAKEYLAAAEHFLRVGRMAPSSKFRPNAEYDAAAALIQLKDWEAAATVLVGFREDFPENPLQFDVTKKIAYVYKENKQLSLAADEYERIERESNDEAIRRDALLVAAELHEEDTNPIRALEAYRRYVNYFTEPIVPNLETRNKIARILKAQNDDKAYLEELRGIVAIDASAGRERTPRTRYLAALAALVLAEREYDAFVAVELVKPLEVNLKKKREGMKRVTRIFSGLVDYEIGETTSASTFYLGEIYAHFSEALMNSERPDNLSPMELEQYELAIEEQAYPFEEQAIGVHEKNLTLIRRGVYTPWVEKSLQKLAEFVPARYNKPEEQSGVLALPETFVFIIDRPTVAAQLAKTDQPGAGTVSENEAPAPEKEAAAVVEPEYGEPAQIEDALPVAETENDEPVQAEESSVAAQSEVAESALAEETLPVGEPETAGPLEEEKKELVAEPGIEEPAQPEEYDSAGQSEHEESAQVEESPPVGERENAEPVQAEESSTEARSDVDESLKEEKAEIVREGEIAQPVSVEETDTVVASEDPEPAPAHPMALPRMNPEQSMGR